MKAICTRGFGIITDPETGEEINVEDEFEVSEVVFERLKAEYSGIEAVSSDDSTDTSEPQENDGPEDTAEICGTEMTDGSICERPAESCPYHE